MVIDTTPRNIGMFENSVVVAAHPDDEVLWFSSALPYVDQLILCFLRVKAHPDWTTGRQKSIAEYPLDNMISLGLDESEVFYAVDWSQPVATDYGLLISRGPMSDAVYRKSFEILQEKLRKLLAGYRNVITHNPWGEYGHIEHVQVYRAIKSLQEELNFDIWYPNYCSNKSVMLMAMSLSQLDVVTQTLPTNKALAESIMNIYKKNNCWTWYDDHEWCDEETFIRDVAKDSTMSRYGSVYTLNMIKVESEPVRNSRPGYYRTVRRKLTNAVKGLGFRTD